MKRRFFILACILAGTTASSSYAQSLKDLFSKDNVEKVVNSITGETENIDLTGTWTYSKPAVEFKSDNLLMKAGGTVASSTVESKLSEQLKKIGITSGKMAFTFNADSTFVTQVGKRTMNGTYSYDHSTKQVTLTYLKLLSVPAKVNCSSGAVDLLFNSDKLLKIMAFLGSKSSNATLSTISSIANKYDGMMLGFDLRK